MTGLSVSSFISLLIGIRNIDVNLNTFLKNPACALFLINQMLLNIACIGAHQLIKLEINMDIWRRVYIG